MTDYSKLKVADLKELLGKRGLSQSGKKEDLISRLTADDAEKASPAKAGTSDSGAQSISELTLTSIEKPVEPSSELSAAPAAPATADLTVDEAKDSGNTAASAASVAPVGTAAPAEGEKKKFTFKRLADEFETPATEAPADKPTVQADDAKPVEPAESFSAGLASTNTDSELEKRKKRAARFGVPVTESIKLMERAKRFGADGDGSDSKGIKELDEALGENRGKKRAPETRIQNEPLKKSKDNPKPAATAKGVLSDPDEKAKAEARAKRFGG
ncbi:hypothetical protein Dda_3560 [Drechslerella dactyloides]|uniref:SAP domain-containing protein n=1 Tax=Drechslerella dactyloides TaxID=74499 RepID=A0AAD6IZP5_DREDA|nr:hypothetical protein Dda_3560 [Drechslerella dactyloides]